MSNEQHTDLETVDLAILRDLARRIALRRPWLAEFCNLIEEEADLLESRGVASAPRLDLAIDIGLLVLERILENDVELDAPEDTGVLKKLN